MHFVVAAAMQAGVQFGDPPIRAANDNDRPLVMPGAARSGETAFVFPALSLRCSESRNCHLHVGKAADHIGRHHGSKRPSRGSPEKGVKAGRRGEWLGYRVHLRVLVYMVLKSIKSLQISTSFKI